MPDFQVDSVRPLLVTPAAGRTVTVKNLSGSPTVSYRTGVQSNITATNRTGTIAAGSELEVTEPTWFLAINTENLDATLHVKFVAVDTTSSAAIVTGTLPGASIVAGSVTATQVTAPQTDPTAGTVKGEQVLGAVGVPKGQVIAFTAKETETEWKKLKHSLATKAIEVAVYKTSTGAQIAGTVTVENANEFTFAWTTGNPTDKEAFRIVVLGV